MTSFEDEFEERFHFISDTNLRKHLGDALRSSTELIAISSKYPQPIRSTFIKTSIIYLASIIEASLHYYTLNSGYKYHSTDWKYKDIKILHKIPASKNEQYSEIIAGKRFKKKKNIEKYVDFAILNKICRDDIKLYEKNTYLKVDNIRKLRNKVHLMTLNSPDRNFNKKTLNSVANTTNDILNIVENKLKNNR